jgi:hypothetical protein
MLTFIPVQTYGQKQKEEVAKERKATIKLSQAELNRKASKYARKDAKRYEKEGWKAKPTIDPIVIQLDKSYLMRHEYDENNRPRYVIGLASSTAETYAAGKKQATQLAIINIAEKTSTQVTEAIENLVATEELGYEEAASTVRTIAGSVNIVAKEIENVIEVAEMYRETGNKTVEVLISVAYSSDMAVEAVKKVVRQDLKDRGDELLKKLEKKLGWDK